MHGIADKLIPICTVHDDVRNYSSVDDVCRRPRLAIWRIPTQSCFALCEVSRIVVRPDFRSAASFAMKRPALLETNPNVNKIGATDRAAVRASFCRLVLTVCITACHSLPPDLELVEQRFRRSIAYDFASEGAHRRVMIEDRDANAIGDALHRHVAAGG